MSVSYRMIPPMRPFPVACSWDRASWPTIRCEPEPATWTSTTLTGGVQAGFNYQMGLLVIGVEGDFNGARSRPSDALTAGLSAPLTGTLAHRVDAKLDWFGTLRGRLGIADARWLIYATGGWAFGHVESSTFVQFSAGGDTYTSSFSDTLSGWTAGGGFEYAFRDNWTVKGEVLWIDLGRSLRLA